MSSLENLKYLKADMLKHNWTISSFTFSFKRLNYIALVILYLPGEKKPDYALVKIDFIRETDINSHLEVPANSVGLMTDAKTLRLFFHIEYSENLGDILKQFNVYLGKIIPKSIVPPRTTMERTTMVNYLSTKDAEDINKIYCYKVKRNPLRKDGSNSERSIFNDNKTKLLRRNLYDKLGKDTTISFCYSDDPLKEKTDLEIMNNWAKNNK